MMSYCLQVWSTHLRYSSVRIPDPGYDKLPRNTGVANPNDDLQFHTHIIHASVMDTETAPYRKYRKYGDGMPYRKPEKNGFGCRCYTDSEIPNTVKRYFCISSSLCKNASIRHIKTSTWYGLTTHHNGLQLTTYQEFDLILEYRYRDTRYGTSIASVLVTSLVRKPSLTIDHGPWHVPSIVWFACITEWYTTARTVALRTGTAICGACIILYYSVETLLIACIVSTGYREMS